MTNIYDLTLDVLWGRMGHPCDFVSANILMTFPIYDLGTPHLIFLIDFFQFIANLTLPK